VKKNTTILKFFLFISKEEQLARFKERLEDPARQWKISESDYSGRKLWDGYTQAFEAALSNCSTDYAPWFVVPSNHKWFRNFAVSQIVADALQDMKLEPPKATVNLEEIRRLYHQDAGSEGVKESDKRQ
jgi:polyphosphate kinase 2 (PPK2 family)